MARSGAVALLLIAFAGSPAPPLEAGDAGPRIPGLEADIARLGLDRAGFRLGIQVVEEGSGVLYSREAGVSRSAASAIKTAIALDLLANRSQALDEHPQGLESLLQPGVHPAMAGFNAEELALCRRELAGRTYRELARIMMGREPATNVAYNAACNLIMIKLGGPEVITERIHRLDPALLGIEINRYMQHWVGDGDNRATPESLVALYRMTAGGSVPGLGPEEVAELKTLLRENGTPRDPVYEKEGTLYPRPMVRVRAGFVDRPGGRVVYAVMGEIPNPGASPSPDLFMRLMNGVDGLAERCRRGSVPAAH